MDQSITAVQEKRWRASDNGRGGARLLMTVDY